MSKRKYRPGQPIRTLDELVKQDLIYFFGRIMPRGWFLNWQLRLTTDYLNSGWIRSAVKIEDGQEDNHAEIH